MELAFGVVRPYRHGYIVIIYIVCPLPIDIVIISPCYGVSIYIVCPLPIDIVIISSWLWLYSKYSHSMSTAY